MSSETTITGLSARQLLAGGLPEEAGERIGVYEIVAPIGEGGMGVVYLAEQIEPVQREVALKLVKRGMDTEALLARFELERQTLAALDHPNIARVLDAGATEGGRPYFVMELVEGVPVTDFADREQIGREARIALFLQACAAVEHAHRRGVIHRDLKPSNLLVDSEGTLKVIDFGLAKLTRPGRGGGQTLAGEVFGTPGYMPPEQQAGDEVDTRADVFALGKVLAELVGGEGELKWVVAKATEEDAAMRYGSVTELAEELHRFLDNRPLSARRPTAVYRLSKFFRRHRNACIAAVVASLLAVFGIAKAIEAAELRHEAEFAEREAQKASVTAAFVNELLSAMDEPDEERRREALRTAVRYFDDHIAAGYRDQPEVAFLTQQMLGVAYKTLGEYELAEKALLDARHLADGFPLGHQDTPMLTGVEIALSHVYTAQGRYDESIEALARILENPQSEVSPERINVHAELGQALCEANRHEEAEQVFRIAAEMSESFTGWKGRTLGLYAWVAHTLHRQGRSGEATKLLEEARDMALIELGADHHEISAAEEDLKRFRSEIISEGP